MQLSPLQSRLAASLVASCLLLALYLFLFPPQFALAAELDLSLGAEHHHRQVQEIVVEDYPHGGGASTGPAVVAAAVDGRTAPEMYEAEFDGFDRGIIGHAPSTGVTALVNNVPVSMDVEAGSTRFFVFEARTIFQPAPEDVDGHTGDTTRKEAGGSVGAGVGVGDDGEGSAESRPELLRRRPQPGGTREIFISVNTCMQPSPLDSTSASGGASRQLRLYVSTSPENTFPGPGQSQGDTQTMTVFDEGAVMFSTVVSSQQDVHIGVSAPNLTDAGFSGVWNFEIAASRDAFYHRYETDATASGTADLHCVGTDRGSALLVTRPLTETMDADEVERMMADGAPQFVMFAHNRKYGAAVDGLRHSFCGLRNNAQITTTTDSASANMVSTSITKRGAGGLPKQQFHVRGLNSTSDYVGILARSVGSGPGSVGGGGIVLRQANFSTSAAQNCFLIKDLSFCTDVDYTVPGNPNVAAFNNDTALGALYDSYARDAYANFEKALAQVQCETDSTARYSLVKTCDDCRAAYKAWLCAVTIPRCEGFVESRTTPPGSFPVPESDPPHLQPRNVDKPFPDGTFLDQAIINAHPGAANRTSRNPAIDSILNPGPYKEVLPCADLCNSLVRSCPAALGFACPRPGEVGFRASYAEGTRCNYPGADPGRSMAVPALGEVRRGAMYALLMAVVTAGTLVAL